MVSGNSRLNHLWSVVLIASAIGGAGDALAQQPSQAQLNALRSSCRSDYMAHCSSVPTGGAPALNCLKQHMSALSSGCQSAVNAISPAAPAPSPVAATAPAAAPPPPPQVTPPAPQLAPPPPPPTMQVAPTAVPAAAPAAPPAAARKLSAAQRQEAKAIAQACRSDYRVHCAGIPPGGSASLACLKRNARTLSRGCLAALVSAPTAGAAHAAPPAAPAAVAVAAPPMEPAPLLVTPREERFIVRNACGADFATYCGGLRPGLGRIAACLHYNRSNLSPRCQQALMALHEGR
jgi:hypothetical protein